MGLNFSKHELIHVCFTSELKNFCSILYIFGKTWLYIVLDDFNLTYYSSIILGSFSILLFPKLCWHIGLTPTHKAVKFMAKLISQSCGGLQPDVCLSRGYAAI